MSKVSISMILKDDLTRYHPSLKTGTKGTIVCMWGSNDCFAKVRFNEVGTMDVLWKGIEITDTKYLSELAEQKRARNEALKTAMNVVLSLGPSGGFKYLTYEYVDVNGRHNHYGNGLDKASAMEDIEVFKQFGIQIQEEREPKKKR